MNPDAGPVADLAEAVGNALLRFAEQVRTGAGPTAASVPAAALQEGLGAAQTLVLEAVRGAGEEGMTARAASEASGVARSNTPRILAALTGRGLTTLVAEGPRVWRAIDLDATPHNRARASSTSGRQGLSQTHL